MQRRLAGYPFGVALLGLLALCSLCSADIDCGRHGVASTDQQTCFCEFPHPDAGQWGWTGTNCDLRVYGAAADGADLTKGCESEGCNFLQHKEWMCFSSPLNWDEPWNYLAVQLRRTSQDRDGDPDLYGLFYSATEDRRPSNMTIGYDFRETSSSSHESVVKIIAKADFVNRNYTGMYLCIKAYGSKNLTFSLAAFTSACPPGFTDDGRKVVCSAPEGVPDSESHSDGCSPEGQCLCRAPYQKPVPEVYPGLGFEDCSAEVHSVADSEFEGDNNFVAEHHVVPAKRWQFYAFNVSEEDFQVVINAAGEADSECSPNGWVELYAKYGQPPGWRYGQYDFRPEWDYYSENDDDAEIRMDANDENFQPGLWFVGVGGDDHASCKYTLTINKWQCPLNCNGHGECVRIANGSRACSCEEGFFGLDCSGAVAQMQFGQSLSQAPAAFEYDYFTLPTVTSSMLSHAVEVHLTASYSSSGYPEWASSRPELLLLKGDQGQPSAGNYTFRQVLQEQNNSYSLALCPSMLSEGRWMAAIYNPMRLYKIGYTLTATKTATCLNDCSGRGRCSEDGECECEGGFAGGDCSISLEGQCQRGTMKQSARPAQHGVCWHECRCDDSGTCAFNENDCADFTCGAGAAGRRLRRKPGANECVEDECTQDEWTEGDSFTCLKSCECPSDGSACRLAAGCSDAHFACKPSFRRFSNGEAKCYKEGCQEGSLQAQAAGQAVPAHSRAMAACVCDGREVEGQPRCSFRVADPQAAVLTCEEGYVLKGASAAEGAGMALGGSCVRAKSGTPGWGVFLWVLFSLVVGAVGGVAVYLFYDRRYNKPGMSASLYQELSVDTGF